VDDGIGGGLDVGGRRVEVGLPEDGGYSVVQTVVFVVMTSRVVVVTVWVEVPPFRSWLHIDNA